MATWGWWKCCGSLCLAVLLGAVAGHAPAAAAADVSPSQEVNYLKRHAPWADRAEALASLVTSPAGGGGPPSLLADRAACWGIPNALPVSLTERLQGNAGEFRRLFDALSQSLTHAPTEPQSGAAAGSAEPSSKQRLRDTLKALEALERRQLLLESEVLQPRDVTLALVTEVLDSPTRADACKRWIEGWQAKLAASHSRQPSEATKAHEVDERIRWEFLDRAADGEIFNSNNSGLPSLMIDEAGAVERLGGTDALAVSLLSARGALRETTGMRGLITFNPSFLWREVPPPQGRDECFSGFVRLQIPVSTTLTDDGLPAPGEPSGRVRRFALTGGIDWDLRDPRRSVRLQCMSAVEALEPWVGPLRIEAISSLRSRRGPYYAQCVRKGSDSLRWGLRASVELFSVRGADGEQRRAGPVALSAVIEPTSFLAAQLAWRRAPWPQAHTEYVAALHLGMGLPRATHGTDGMLRLGVDTSLSLANPGRETERLQWLIAPSLLFKVTPQSFATVSVGYLHGFSHSGVMVNLGLTFDADRYLTYEVPPASL